MPTSAAQIRDGQTVLYYAVTLIPQTLCLGGYTALIVFSSRALLKRGLNTQATKTLFWLSIFMYTMSLAYWSFSVIDFVARMQFFIDPENPTYASLFNGVAIPFNLFNALVLINFSITDGIVVWRASVICPRTQLHRRLLWIPTLFLLLTTVFASILIVLRFIAMFSTELVHRPFFTPMVDTLQFFSVITSLFSNLSATTLIGATAWRHRQRIRFAFHQRSKAEHTLMLLLESGLLYCATAVFVVAALFIRLPHGTLGDIYLPVTVQLAGAYAPAISLLILRNRTLNETEFLGTETKLNVDAEARGQFSGPIQFANLNSSSIATSSSPS
ncbi:hypothetical protein MIND_00095100 [Mycena indigotica]|uniref:Uncharacterized protein n=1 Tax=Mycena indigotica TaxID=2126181 RepID=A0A8H6THE2_9AGAR|nr:uncharacterized protein MIND_00095100 [Mycena indigotica]KAF7315790.1 hypothetical protein MIND_00095100 [Mycena indigotica]